MRRILMGAAAAAMAVVPVSLAAISDVTPAGAAGSSISCTKMSGSLLTGVVSIGKCSPLTTTDKKGAGTISGLAGGGGAITWTGKKGVTYTTPISTSFTVYSDSASTPGWACKAAKKGVDSQSEIVISGTVVAGGTSPDTATGDVISATLCETLSNGKIALAKGTTAGL